MAQAKALMPTAGELPPWLQAQRTHLQHFAGQALLLHGASGLGQFELASELARLWLCEAPMGAVPCGHCSSCKGFAARTHADLLVLMPETESLLRQWPLSEAAQSDIDSKKRKPSKEIRVEAVRAVVQFGQRTAGTERGKVVVVYPAEKMNTIAANTLLKTLEEPPGALRFILASASVYDLLPTVRSRCVGETLAWPAPEASFQWLVQQGIDAADARVLLRFCGDRPLDALALHQEGFPASLWRDFPRAVQRGDAALLTQLGPVYAVMALQKLCHDLSRLSVGASSRYFEKDQLPSPPKPRALHAWAKSLTLSARSAEHPFGQGLMMEALLSQAQQALATQALSN